MSNRRDEALAVLAAALQVDPGSLDDTSAPGQTPGWDSLAHMRLVTALEERFERPLEPLEIVSIGGIEDVVRLLDVA